MKHSLYLLAAVSLSILAFSSDSQAQSNGIAGERLIYDSRVPEAHQLQRPEFKKPIKKLTRAQKEALMGKTDDKEKTTEDAQADMSQQLEVETETNTQENTEEESVNDDEMGR